MFRQKYDGIIDTETGRCYSLQQIAQLLKSIRETRELKITAEEGYHMLQTALVLERLAKEGNQKRPQLQGVIK